jgi:hypothetical protein
MSVSSLELSPEHLQRYAVFWWTMAGYEMWGYHSQTTGEIVSMRRKHLPSRRPKKFKLQPSVGKARLMSFFSLSGLLIATFNDPDITINTQCYCGALQDFLHQENAAWHSHILHDNVLPRECPVTFGARSATCVRRLLWAIAHAHLTCQRVNSICSGPWKRG